MVPREAPATTLQWLPGAQAPVVGPNFPTGATTTLRLVAKRYPSNEGVLGSLTRAGPSA